MIRQEFNVEHYWKVIVYYNIDYNLFPYIVDELYRAGIKDYHIDEIYDMMSTGKAKGFTISKFKNRISIVGFNRHKTKGDYINSITHEAEHIKQDMLKCYKVKDADEPPAYTIGFLVMKMMKVFKELL